MAWFTESRYRIAHAWQHGWHESGSNVSTNGHEVYSYAHVVGITDERGKVAYDCHYSLTTAQHCAAFKGVADVVVPCVSCAR